MKPNVTVLMLAAIAPPAQSASELLGSTTIDFSATGMTNTISGTWQASSLLIGESESVDFYTLKITDYSASIVDKPISYIFDDLVPRNVANIYFCGMSACSTDSALNSTGTVYRDSLRTWGWEFLSRLTAETQAAMHNGYMSASYSSGGLSANAAGTITVSAYKEIEPILPPPSPIPLPAAIWLFGSGLIGLLGLRAVTS